MLNIDVFSDFISVGAAKGISKFGKAILNEDFEYGMSGYDVEDLVKHVVAENNKITNILQNFSFDSESGMFCMYYKHNGQTNRLQITDEVVSKCAELVKTINELMIKKYMEAVSDFNPEPKIYYVGSVLTQE